MNKVYLLTGGNIGDRQMTLATAKKKIEAECGRIVRSSALYETAAWGNTHQSPFLNQALELETLMTAKQLIRKLLEIEEDMGRIRTEKYGPRIIDIDILLFNAEKYEYPHLKVPHPELQNRRFALLPLAEIGANLIHPLFNKTIAQLLDECQDQLELKKYS